MPLLPLDVCREAHIPGSQSILPLRSAASDQSPPLPPAYGLLLRARNPTHTPHHTAVLPPRPASSCLCLLLAPPQETFFERLADSAIVQRLNAVVDRVFQNYFVAVLMDVVGVLLFFFDIYTDALVVDVSGAGWGCGRLMGTSDGGGRRRSGRG
jgi:hypothetical protein